MNLQCVVLSTVVVGLFIVGQSPVSAQSPTANSSEVADVNASIGTAARMGDATAVAGLLKRPGANVNAVALEKKTPLMWAALYGHLKTVETLVSAGARVNEKDPQGATALTYAAAGVHPKVVAFLSSVGAEPAPIEKLGALWILGQPSDVFDYMAERAKNAKDK